MTTKNETRANQNRENDHNTRLGTECTDFEKRQQIARPRKVILRGRPQTHKNKSRFFGTMTYQTIRDNNNKKKEASSPNRSTCGKSPSLSGPRMNSHTHIHRIPLLPIPCPLSEKKQENQKFASQRQKLHARLPFP